MSKNPQTPFGGLRFVTVATYSGARSLTVPLTATEETFYEVRHANTSNNQPLTQILDPSKDFIA